MKRIIIPLLCLALLASGFSALAAAPARSFPDITDAETARDVAVLSMLGVVDGDDQGRFNPGASLTRAQFCKMAIILLGRGDEEPMYRNRTIFQDVTGSHWARGYINMAVTGERKFTVGMGDNYFYPDQEVTVAQAVTMCMRILGYTDADAGMSWPNGYMALAAEKSMLVGIDVSDVHAPMTRAQAARLLNNMLAADMKGDGPFIGTLGAAAEGVIILNITGSDEDGLIQTSAGDFRAADRAMSRDMIGLRGTLLRDKNGRVRTFLPDRTGQRTVIAAEAESSWLRDAEGARYTIDPNTTAYTATETAPYGTAFINIAPGTSVTLYFGRSGEVEALYISTGATSDKALVAGGSVSAAALLDLTGGVTGYAIYKNGVRIELSDIAPYDVITYDAAGRVLRVSDFRLTGALESCWPNLSSPTRVTVFGREFQVLPSARSSFASRQLGQMVTLLLTGDFKVAGVVSSGTLENTAVGIVTAASGTSVTVRLLNGLEISGDTERTASSMLGEFVSVSSYGAGKIAVSKISGGAGGRLDLNAKTLGSSPLSPALRVFERAGKGPVKEIKLNDITVSSVPASKVLFSTQDGKGRVTLLLLDDVTGDCYTYGILRRGSQEIPSMGSEAGGTNPTVSVRNSKNPGGTAEVVTGALFSTGDFGGVSAPIGPYDSAKVVLLKNVGAAKRTDFFTRDGKTYVRVNGEVYPVADAVECYNKSGNSWFKSLDDARSFSETLTLYADRTASEGGKIRVVVA